MRPAATWLPNTLHADQLQGLLGRLTAGDVAVIVASLAQPLNLRCLEPGQFDP